MSPRPTVQEVGAIVGKCQALGLALPDPQEAERAALADLYEARLQWGVWRFFGGYMPEVRTQAAKAVRAIRIARIRAQLAEGN